MIGLVSYLYPTSCYLNYEEPHSGGMPQVQGVQENTREAVRQSTLADCEPLATPEMGYSARGGLIRQRSLADKHRLVRLWRGFPEG
jgi:hypothetical protein